MAEVGEVKFIADVQCSSQVGNIAKYYNFSALFPNEKEARVSLQDKASTIESLSQRMIKETKCKNLIMVRSIRVYIYQTEAEDNIQSSHYPAISVNALDTAGAGDSMLATFALGIVMKQDLNLVSIISACMASIAVEQMGNCPIKANQLMVQLDDVFNW